MKKPTRELVDAFFAWFRNDAHSSKENCYTTTLTYDQLSQMDRNGFIEFFYQFACDGGQVQSGGHRTASRFRAAIEDRYDEFRAFAMEPFAESFDEAQWLERIREFSHFGVGLATIFLNRVDKKRFAIINNKADDAVELFDISVPTVLARRYQVVRDAWRQLIEWYPEFDNFYRTDALSQFLIGEDSGKPWAAELRKGGELGEKHYWIYAPGERARHWDEYSRQGLMGVGWDAIKEDLSVYTTEEDLRKKYNDLYGDQATEIDFRQLCDFLRRMRKGDGVFVKRGIKELVGYGEVTSDYLYDAERSEYRHLRRVKWFAVGEWPIPDEWKVLPVKTLTELRDRKRIQQYRAMLVGGGEMALPAEGFALLEQLHNSPTTEFYNVHIEEFKRSLEQPFQQMLRAVAQRLRPEVRELMETEKRIFSRIPKNDWGRGGAWDFYWGAFYPKGGKRIEDAQLFVFMHGRHLDFGFYIGAYGSEQRRRFTAGCSNNLEALKGLLKDSLSRDDLSFGERTTTDDGALALGFPDMKWDRWLSQVDQAGIRAGVTLARDEVLAMPANELIEKIARIFNELFPLVYLATEDDPLPDIRRYVGDRPDPDETINPDYSLEQCAADTHFDVEVFGRWVSAIERKKQAIFYGPPGTGKTFIAEKLARHLIGGGDGISEIVQFHPSYAYEDFMQGLRPRAMTGGGLEYAMIPGRFRDFCRRARECSGRCVLVIDEINRANLSRVLGELMFLLEYRDQAVPLAGGERFQIPGNVRIIGTMNTDEAAALRQRASGYRGTRAAHQPLPEHRGTAGYPGAIF